MGASFADLDHAVELMENSPAGTLVKAVTLMNVPTRSGADLRCDLIEGNDAGEEARRGGGFLARGTQEVEVWNSADFSLGIMFTVQLVIARQFKKGIRICYIKDRM